MAITGVSSISGQQIIAAGALSAASAGTALYDENGNSLTSYLTAVPEGYATTGDLTGKQDTLTFGYDENNAISSINESALAGGNYLSSVSVDSNLSGNGTTASAIGLRNRILIDSNNTYIRFIDSTATTPTFAQMLANDSYGMLSVSGATARIQATGNNVANFSFNCVPSGQATMLAGPWQTSTKWAGISSYYKNGDAWLTVRSSGTKTPNIKLISTAGTATIYPSSISSWNNKQDSLTFGYDSNDAISSINESALAGGGGASYTSPLGTILVSGSTLEATNSAIGTIVDTVVTGQLSNTYFSSLPSYPYDSYSAQKTDPNSYLTILYGQLGDGIQIDDIFRDADGVVEIPLTSGGYNLTLFNGTNFALSAVSDGVIELATKHDLNGYATTADKAALSGAISSVSANVSALSAKTPITSNSGTIYFNGQSIESTTSAVNLVQESHACIQWQDVVIASTFTGGPFNSYSLKNNNFGQSRVYVKYYDGDWSHDVTIPFGGTVDISAEYEGSALYAVLSENNNVVLNAKSENIVKLATTDEIGGHWESATLYSNPTNTTRATAWNLSDNASAYDYLESTWVDVNGWRIKQRHDIPSAMASSGTRGANFNSVYEYPNIWFKSMRWSAIESAFYMQVDEFAVTTSKTIYAANPNQAGNRPLMYSIVGWKFID